ncbi:helix-turn-helix domain-containing protein [Robertmurraya massiliosenegalensis]|uniref:hypothetical protein n=1 Tax=Robertmurraya massiliosenegalensis TaxID=1287657 RepID=UPI0002DE8064|nr:hypothetical protein [Robertmurraya massiliosenegalensis]
MEKNLRNLRKAMDSSTHKGLRFTEVQKEKIRFSLFESKMIGSKKSQFHVYVLTSLAISFFLLVFFIDIKEHVILNDGVQQGTQETLQNEWEVRYSYKKNGRELFAVFPDPFLTAGKPFGYIFSFKESFDTYKGKEIEIDIIHQETGERINVLPSQKITEPTPGYSSLNRFTTEFIVPNTGLWKYEVYLDEKLYGDVIVSIESEEITPIFLPENIPEFVQKRDFEQIDWERKAIDIGDNMIGNVDKSGVIGADMPSVKMSQKWMWHLWGIENPLNMELTVVGFHKKERTAYPILNGGWNLKLGGENNGADAHTPSSVKLPMTGEWAILLYVNGKLFDTLILNIHL